jgi:exodeoxyribonuclease VII small subunit
MSEKDSVKKIDFEKMFNELEEIVRKMEEGNLKLTESLELFERGVKISKILKKELEEIEHKVELLVNDDETGELKTEKFKRVDE